MALQEHVPVVQDKKEICFVVSNGCTAISNLKGQIFIVLARYDIKRNGLHSFALLGSPNNPRAWDNFSICLRRPNALLKFVAYRRKRFGIPQVFGQSKVKKEYARKEELTRF